MARNNGNKYTARRNNKSARDGRTTRFEPIPDLSGLDVVVSDDDPEVAADLAAKTAELEAAAAEAVAGMQTQAADPTPTPMTGIVTEPVPEPEPEPDPEPEPEPEPAPAPAPERPQPPAPEEPEELDEYAQLLLAADTYEADGVLPPVTDYLAQLNAEEKLHQAQILRLEDARRIQEAEREAAEKERKRQEYEQYLSERKLILLARVKRGDKYEDKYYDVALAEYKDQGWGDELPEHLVRAVYWHPDSKEIWEIEDQYQQTQAKAKVFAERKKVARSKKSGKKGRNNNSGGANRH